MALTKEVIRTLPATGNRLVTLETVDGVQWVRYHVTDEQGEGHATSFTVAAVLAANPSIDAGVFATSIAAFRAFGDAACGFAES
jgi:hypothetical protein